MPKHNDSIYSVKHSVLPISQEVLETELSFFKNRGSTLSDLGINKLNEMVKTKNKMTDLINQSKISSFGEESTKAAVLTIRGSIDSPLYKSPLIRKDTLTEAVLAEAHSRYGVKTKTK